MRSVLKFILAIFGVLGAFVVVFALTLIEKDPLVQSMAPPTSQEVMQARAFVGGVRQAVDPEEEAVASAFVTNETELNSVIKLGARIFPGFRGTVRVENQAVLVEASLPLDRIGLNRWANFSAGVPAFEERVSLTQVKAGRFYLPSDFTLEAIRVGSNLVFGQNFGDTVLNSASQMQIKGDQLSFVLTMDKLGSNGIMRGMFGSMRGSDMPGPADIARYHTLIRQAMDRGDLPTKGSYLPYVLFTLNAALEGSRTEDPRNAYTSALFGLSLACGARDFNLIVGGLTDNDLIAGGEWKTSCAEMTFNDRIDSRRHFTTAAAIQSASNRGFSISVGEFKELYDSVKSGGFDFTDIAANNSGIRMSNLFMSAPTEDWPALIARIQIENDVIVPFDDIPQIMSGDTFEATYGDVESPEYKALLANIEGRIDAIALHR